MALIGLFEAVAKEKPMTKENGGADPRLNLDHVRQTLIRIEDTILFALIERAQWRRNRIIYRPGGFPELAEDGESLCGFLLRETEKVHARMRRYTSPDEIPFFSGLPEPLLSRRDEGPAWLPGPLVNLNADIRRRYSEWAIPMLCREGDDGQYGSSAVCDVHCLQAISRRIHYGRFVAESKYRENPNGFDVRIAEGDEAGLRRAITHPAVEREVVDRVRRKASAYLSELRARGVQANPEADVVAAFYRDWIIPCNKEVQVRYLLGRRRGASGASAP